MEPIIQLANVSLEFLLVVLQGIKGVCWIVIEVTTPSRTEEAPKLRLTGSQETTANLGAAIKAIAAETQSPTFTLSLYRSPIPTGNVEDAAAFGLPTVIQAPKIAPNDWRKMNRTNRQGLLIEAIMQQTGWNQTRLCKKIGAVRSHLSNIASGKRGLGWNFANKLISNLPLSDEMIRMIREVATN